jgi:polar amino acid transport system permease protein
LDFKKEQSPISPTPLKPEATILNAVPIRHYGRWIATVFLLLVAAVMVKSLLTNPRFRWGVVGEYIVSTPILEGLRLTLILTVVAQLLGIVIGIVLAIMRLSSNRVLARAAWIYIWFFRGTPLLVQLIFWYNISALYPEIAFGIPFGPTFWQGNANELITPFAVAILGLALNEGAYMAEIVRGGIAGIDRGQSESAKALGMTHMQTLRRIILPQAVKVIIPPTGNQTILMLKTTSLVSVLALADLLYTAQTIYARTFETMPLLLVASLWYLVITSVLTFGQYFLERHFTEGAPERMSFTQRFTGFSSMRRKSAKQSKSVQNQSGEAEHND